MCSNLKLSFNIFDIYMLIICLALSISLLICSPALTANESFEQALEQGKTYLENGQTHLALKTIESIQPSTSAQNTQKIGFLGLLSFQAHDYGKAKSLLLNAIHRSSGNPIENARWLATLANLESIRGNLTDAEQYYDDALKQSGKDATLSTMIRLGQASLMPIQQRLDELKKIKTMLSQISNSFEITRFLVNIGSQAQSLGANGLELAYDSFALATNQAEQYPRLLAEAGSGLAQLYEEDKRTQEALQLNDHAIKAALSVNANDLLIELEWRKARLHRSLNETYDALAAYQRAVLNIESIRQDIPVDYAEGRSSFRDTLEPIYFGLAELQIEVAKKSQGTNQSRQLQNARKTIEILKRSEMEEFLGGRCALINNKMSLLEAVEPQTAIFYPIIFPNRLDPSSKYW